MLEQGFVDEVQRLRQRGDLTTDLPAVRAVGYRQLWSFLEGDLSFAEARDAAIAANRRTLSRLEERLAELRCAKQVVMKRATA